MLKLKYIITTFCFVFILQFSSIAQPGKYAAIESEKIAYITKQLKLTPTEAQRFFPIYNMYNEETWALRQAKKKERNDVISFDAHEVEIKKKYRGEFSKVIGTTRASQFFQVVEDFHELLKNTLKDRRNRD